MLSAGLVTVLWLMVCFNRCSALITLHHINELTNLTTECTARMNHEKEASPSGSTFATAYMDDIEHVCFNDHIVADG